MTGSIGLGVLRFGAPLAIGMVLHTTFNLVDMFMISRLPEATPALAALGVCDMVAAVAAILSNGVSTAAVARLGRALGGGDLTGVRRATWQSLWLVTALSIVLGGLGLFGSDFIIRDVMQTKGDAAALAVPYLEVMLGGCFSIFWLLQVTSLLRALGHAKTSAALLVSGNLLNLLLNVLFIYGPGPAPEVFSFGAPLAEALGIPRLGVMGAAWATLVARCVPVVIGIILLARRRGGPRFHSVYLRPFGGELAALVKLGWPASAQLVLRIGAFLFFIALINAAYTSAEDPAVLTAYSICLRLETMVLFVGMGWGAAASSYVSVNLGAGRPERAKRAGVVAALYNLIMMLGVAAVYLTFADPIIAFFDADPRVREVGVAYLEIVALSYAALGAGVVLSQAMMGAGATLSSLVLDLLVLACCVLPAAYFTVATYQAPKEALFMVAAAGNVIGALVFAAYYAHGSFLRKTV